MPMIFLIPTLSPRRPLFNKRLHSNPFLFIPFVGEKESELLVEAFETMVVVVKGSVWSSPLCCLALSRPKPCYMM